jgi:hypothetical protein
MPVAVDTSGRIYEDFLRLLFLNAHRETSTLPNDIPEEYGHFRFLRSVCLTNIKGSVGLILVKVSDMRISIPLDLSPRPFIPPPRFTPFFNPVANKHTVTHKTCKILLHIGSIQDARQCGTIVITSKSKRRNATAQDKSISTRQQGRSG